MKTNLSDAYGTDKNLEKDGKWFDIATDVKFCMKRMGGHNAVRVNELRAKYIRPHIRQIEKNLLPKEVEQKLYVKVFVESCMVDWSGLSDDEGDIKFTNETAVELFMSTPDLFDTVFSLSNDSDSYKEDLGNS